MHGDVFVGKSKAETRALLPGSSACRSAAREAFEDALLLAFDEAITVIFDDDPRAVGDRRSLQDHLRCATAVNAGIVEQVGEDSGEAASIAKNDDACEFVFGDDWRSREAACRNCLVHELDQREWLEDESDCASIETRDLEEVLDESLKACDIAREEIERRLRAFRHFVPA
jgi:sugar/nucleoside kinase (ribokinase family)